MRGTTARVLMLGLVGAWPMASLAGGGAVDEVPVALGADAAFDGAFLLRLDAADRIGGPPARVTWRVGADAEALDDPGSWQAEGGAWSGAGDTADGDGGALVAVRASTAWPDLEADVRTDVGAGLSVRWSDGRRLDVIVAPADGGVRVELIDVDGDEAVVLDAVEVDGALGLDGDPVALRVAVDAAGVAATLNGDPAGRVDWIADPCAAWSPALVARGPARFAAVTVSASSEERVLRALVGPGASTVEIDAEHADGRRVSGRIAVSADAGRVPRAFFEAPATAEVGEIVRLDARDALGDGLAGRWLLGDGTPAVGLRPYHAWRAPGTPVVGLTVVDGLGRDGRADAEVDVQVGAPPVAAAGGPYRAVAGRPLRLDGRASTDDGTIVDWRWDLAPAVDSDRNGDPTDDADARGPWPAVVFAEAGRYPIELAVVDGAGQSAVARAEVEVAAVAAPTVMIVRAPEGRHPVVEGRSTMLKAVVDGPGPMTVRWRFDDGSPQVEEIVEPGRVELTHTFGPGPVERDVVLEVEADGQQATATYAVRIVADDEPARTRAAIDDALWWLYGQQSADGTWPGRLVDGDATAAATAAAARAFVVRGYHPAVVDDPYAEAVRRALDALDGRVRSGRPSPRDGLIFDSDGDELRLEADGRRAVQTGFLIDLWRALPTLPGGPVGVPFVLAVRDAVDAYGWGQNDGGPWGIDWRGGGGSHGAASGHAGLGLVAGRATGVPVVGAVVDRLGAWIDQTVVASGIAERPGAATRVSAAASALVELAGVGTGPASATWCIAERAVAAEWASLSTVDAWHAARALRAGRDGQLTPDGAAVGGVGGLDALRAVGSDGVDVLGAARAAILARVVDDGPDRGRLGDGGDDPVIGTALAVELLDPAFVAPPVAIAAAGELVEGGALVLDGRAAVDPLDDGLGFEWSCDGAQLDDARTPRATVRAGGLDGAPGASIDCQVEVTDGLGRRSTATVPVRVVNAAPIIERVAAAPGEEGQPLPVEVEARDPGGDPLSVALDCDGDGAFDDGPDTCVPADDGPLTIEVRVTDDDGGEARAAVEVEVANLPPTIEAPDCPVAIEGGAVELPFAVADPGPVDRVGCVLIDPPAGVEIDAERCVVTWVPTYDQGVAGEARIDVGADDGDGGRVRSAVRCRVALRDDDGDGVPDTDEPALGLEVGVDDCEQDRDGDGVSGCEEYARGTDPLVSDLPDAPTLLAPVEAVVTTVTPTLELEPPAGEGVRFVFRVFDADGAVVAESGVVDTPRWTTPALAENGRYRWTGAGVVGVVEGPAAEPVDFAVDARPEPPETPRIVNPTADGIAPDARPLIELEGGGDPDPGAVVEIACETAPAESPEAFVAAGRAPRGADGQGTRLRFESELPEDTGHRVRCRAEDDDGEASPWSEVVAFTVNTRNDAPSPPTPISPIDVAVDTDRPTFVVGNSADADGDRLTYVFRISLDPEFPPGSTLVGEGVPQGADGQTRWIPPQALENRRDYYWSAAADDGARRSLWTRSPFRVVVSAPPAVPFLVEPMDGEFAEGGEPVVFTWTAVDDPDGDAVRYGWRIVDAAGDELDAAESDGPSIEREAPRAGGVLRWQVRAIDETGAISAWSDSRILDVAPQDPDAGTGPLRQSSCACDAAESGALADGWWLVLLFALRRKRQGVRT